MKNCMDRLIPRGDPHFEKDPHGEVRHVSGEKKDPKCVMKADSGFPEQTHFQELRLFAQRMIRNFDTDLTGKICLGGGGPLLQEEELRPWIDADKMQLRKPEEKSVREEEISTKTAFRLELPLIPAPGYVDVFIKIQ